LEAKQSGSHTIFADVVLPLPLSDAFTYHIPEELSSNILPGIRVIVKFGKKKYYSGLILKIHTKKPLEYDTKPIESVLDKKPVIDNKQFDFWRWIASYYHCSLGEVMKAALPSGLKLESETKVILNPEHKDSETFSSREELTLKLLRDKKIISIQELNNAIQNGSAFSVIKSLLKKDAIFVEEQINKSYRPKTEIFIALTRELEDEKHKEELLTELKKSQKQQQLLKQYFELTDYFASNAEREISRRIGK
jgi:primosomal protein N' (replication factor Y)